MNKKYNSTVKRFSLITLLLVGSGIAFAQPPGGQDGPPPTPQEAAPFDITGYWVSIVTEDWRWRMLAAQPGDTGSIPLNQAGMELAEAWTPNDSDLESCLAVGGAGIMRYPGRLHITWEDEDTLRIDFSAGEQTRLLHFDGSAAGPGRSLQGHTTASWYKERQTRGLGFGGPVRSFEGGNLHATTTNLSAAWLQRNGVPYSDETTIQDYYRVIDGPTGEKWLVVTSVVSDPLYLRQDWITSTHFKMEPNGDNWDPFECQ